MNPDPQKTIWNLNFSGDRDGPAILWLHGFLGTHRDWHPIVEDHFRDYHNIVPDLPGHGASVLHSHSLFPAIANDLFQQLSHAAIQSFSIVGYSMGGRFGLHFQKRYLCHVDALIGLSIGPGLKTEAERQLRLESDRELIRRMKEQGLNEFLQSWYRSPLFRSINSDPEIKNELIRSRSVNDPEQLGRSLEVLGNGALYSLWDYLPEMDLPVLLASGELDDKYCKINSEMSELIQGSVHHVFEDVDHAFHLEKPLETALLIRNFLRNRIEGE